GISPSYGMCTFTSVYPSSSVRGATSAGPTFVIADAPAGASAGAATTGASEGVTSATSISSSTPPQPAAARTSIPERIRRRNVLSVIVIAFDPEMLKDPRAGAVARSCAPKIADLRRGCQVGVLPRGAAARRRLAAQ